MARTKPAAGKKQYHCYCSYICKLPWPGKEVSKSTYRNHAKHRERDDWGLPPLPWRGQQTEGSVEDSDDDEAASGSQGRGPEELDDGITAEREERMDAPTTGANRVSSALDSPDQHRRDDPANPDREPDPYDPGPALPDNSEVRADPGSIDDPRRSVSREQPPPVPGGPDEDRDEPPDTNIPDPDVNELRRAKQFCDAIRDATLENGNLPPDVLYRLRHPPEGPLELNADQVLSIEFYLATHNASENAYKDVCRAAQKRSPDVSPLSLYKVKLLLEEITGVVSVPDDMCPNSCHAYTGPYQDLDRCAVCHEPRFEQKPDGSRGPRQVSHSILVGPQLQARRRSPQKAHEMDHRHRYTQGILRALKLQKYLSELTDILSGSEYIQALSEGKISRYDIVLLFSMDGAQLYEHKQSDCWIYIWVIADIEPGIRYKKQNVLIGGVIPGPNNPKDHTSFLFRSFHHLSALQREGLRMWDALTKKIIMCRPYLLHALADGPGLSYITSLVGHPGRRGCRKRCQCQSRLKPGTSQYCACHLKPDDYDIEGSNHGDVDVWHIPEPRAEEYNADVEYLLASTSERDYRKRRLETGIIKPSILSALHNPPVMPQCIVADLMHLCGANLPELLCGLWRGSLRCFEPDDKRTWDFAVLKGELWDAHGASVEAVTPYLPGSFDRTPRNPAEKINSGYKAWEFIVWLYGLGPALFYDVLPLRYWKHFCKLCFAIRLLFQRTLTAQQLLHVRTACSEFVHDYEMLYYQRMPQRMHFCRQSIHYLLHTVPDTFRGGPLGLLAQWLMERMIGDFGQQIKQPSNPYQNLSRRGKQQAQLTALAAIFPEFDNSKPPLPHTAIDLGDGYALLHPTDRTRTEVSDAEGRAFRTYLDLIEPGSSTRWEKLRFTRRGRLLLPSGQVVRSLWREQYKPLSRLRMSRNIKFKRNGRDEIGEVQYFFQVHLRNSDHSLAMVSVFSRPEQDVLDLSHQTVWLTRYCAQDSLQVINVKQIQTVVAMIPAPQQWCIEREQAEWWVLVEKPGLEVTSVNGYMEEYEEDE